MNQDPLVMAALWQLYRKGFKDGREYEHMDTLEAMRSVAPFDALGVAAVEEAAATIESSRAASSEDRP